MEELGALGGVPLMPAGETVKRFSGMLWGMPGCGKTTFACTAPGKKLIVNFDPDGPASIAQRDDVTVLDLSAQPEIIVEKLKGESPLGLSKYLSEHPEIETVILDSATTLAQLCLLRAVATTKNSSIEVPTQAGYARRNSIMREVLRAFLAVTAKHQRHFILLAHEAAPTTNDDGVILYISLMLNEGVTTDAGLKMSEVWYLGDDGKGKRTLAVRPCRMRKPMKTRMFITNKDPEFTLKYDAGVTDSENTHTIANWWNAFHGSGGKKMELPK